MEIRAERTTQENFKEFGTFFDPSDVLDSFDKTCFDTKFFPDKVPLVFNSSSVVSLSVLWLKKRPLQFNIVEAHEYTEEIIGGFNRETAIHVIGAGNDPDFSKVKVFILPKNSWVRFKRNIWHHEPFVTEAEETFGYVIIPPFSGTADVNVINSDYTVRIIL